MHEYLLQGLEFIAIVILMAIGRKLQVYFNVKTTAEEQMLFSELARQAVFSIEQKMGMRDRQPAVADKYTSKDKSEAARSVLRQLAEARGLSKETISTIDTAIEDAVARMNL